MRILIDPSSQHSLNMGDVAMLQVTYRRLRQFWPQAEIYIFNSTDELLQLYCPGAIRLDPEARYAWYATGATLTRFARRRSLPALSEFEVACRQAWPGGVERLVQQRSGHAAAERLREYRNILSGCDLVVASGAGQVTNSFAGHATLVLNTLEAAIRRGIPTVMFGQGIGPITDPVLRARAARVLPKVSLICLRETLTGPGLLDSLGVSRDRVAITGDDAIELANSVRPAQLGDCIGVNLRMSWYSDIPDHFIELLRTPLQGAARECGAPLISIPISRHPEECDQEICNQLFAGYPLVKEPAHNVVRSEGMLGEVGRCRVVVTTSYHGGVFALSQGIPVVGWLKSKYFAAKLLGLANQFGTGCEVVLLDEGNVQESVQNAILSAWKSAEQIRPRLLEAAARQIAASKAAYERVYREIVPQQASAEHATASLTR